MIVAPSLPAFIQVDNNQSWVNQEGPLGRVSLLEADAAIRRAQDRIALTLVSRPVSYCSVWLQYILERVSDPACARNMARSGSVPYLWLVADNYKSSHDLACIALAAAVPLVPRQKFRACGMRVMAAGRPCLCPLFVRVFERRSDTAVYDRSVARPQWTLSPPDASEVMHTALHPRRIRVLGT